MRAFFLVMLLSGVAWAERAPARSMAVLEFRGGTTAMRDVGSRLAGILRRTTAHPIVDGDDARRMAGAKIDAEVARCAGEPKCVAAIGGRLGVDEVLLVGVSELGDVILALQRVDTKGAQVLARVADSLPRGNDPDDAALEGYLKQLLPKEDFVRFGTLDIKSNEAGALVEVGGLARGQTPLAPFDVEAPAKLDLRVSKDGFSDFRARVDVLPESTLEVHAQLTRRPVDTSAWYQKWWVWAIAGGVAVAGVTTALVLSQGDTTSVPVMVSF